MSETEQRKTLGGRVRPFTVPARPGPPAQTMKSPERAGIPSASLRNLERGAFGRLVRF